ncbi:MAG: DUF4268 domain-containing protein, partial [Ignavibacteria bacterium]|nr:DUF4268 domain-containing protein [Ignavibacteria bacterium]
MADVIRDHSEAWTDADINSRTQHLIDIIFQIWPAPSGYRSNILAVVQRFGSDIGLVDLLQSGAIVPGQVLVPIPSGYEHVSATVTFEGKILYNGIEHQTPSAAGSAVRNGKSTNGWGFWAVETKDGPSLRALRAKLRRQMGPDVEDQNEDDDGDPQNEGGTSSRQELQFSFWTGFGQFVNDSDRPFSPKSPRRQNWMPIAIGTTRYRIDAVATTYSIEADNPGGEIRVDFNIIDDYPLFEKL